MDVRWHPQHPGIFAQVDASGHVDMYNLCQSVDRPVLSASTPKGRGLNRVAWERRGTLPEHGTQGATRLAAGGMDGETDDPRDDSLWDTKSANEPLLRASERFRKVDVCM